MKPRQPSTATGRPCSLAAARRTARSPRPPTATDSRPRRRGTASRSGAWRPARFLGSRWSSEPERLSRRRQDDLGLVASACPSPAVAASSASGAAQGTRCAPSATTAPALSLRALPVPGGVVRPVEAAAHQSGQHQRVGESPAASGAASTSPSARAASGSACRRDCRPRTSTTRPMKSRSWFPRKSQSSDRSASRSRTASMSSAAAQPSRRPRRAARMGSDIAQPRSSRSIAGGRSRPRSPIRAVRRRMPSHPFRSFWP